MRKLKPSVEQEQMGMGLIVGACALWIVWHDIGMLLPLAGVVGGLLSMAEMEAGKLKKHGD